jgi:hypothetical protein
MKYIVFNLKEEVEAFCTKVDIALGYPKTYALGKNTGLDSIAEKTYFTYAAPIKKYNAEKYAYPVTEANRHLIPAEKEMVEYLENWYPDGII